MNNELSKGFTGIEINGVRFSNIREMLTYMDKQRYRIIDLEKENAELKKEWQEQVQKATDEGYARTLQTMQLTKAKEIIKDITSSYGSTEVSEAQMYLKIKKAEQFLKDCEVEK